MASLVDPSGTFIRFQLFVEFLLPSSFHCWKQVNRVSECLSITVP